MENEYNQKQKDLKRCKYCLNKNIIVNDKDDRIIFIYCSNCNGKYIMDKVN